MKKLIVPLLMGVLISVVGVSLHKEDTLKMAVGGGLGTIEQLSQWRNDGTNITQNVASTTIKLTGYESSGDCLVTDASGVVSTSTCASGGSSLHTDGGTFVYPTGGLFHSAPFYTATSSTLSTFPSLASNYLDFATSAAHSVSVGELAWNNDEGTLDLGYLGGNVVNQIGQETTAFVKSAETIANGEVVYASGAVGASGKIEVSKYIANNTIDELFLFGVATEDIANGDFGYISVFGKVRGVSSDGSAVGESWIDGTILYASAATSGAMTMTAPVAPNQAIPVAFVINAHTSNGTLQVRPSHGWHIGELHDVHAPTPADGDGLLWSNSNSRWENGAVITETEFAASTTIYNLGMSTGLISLQGDIAAASTTAVIIPAGTGQVVDNSNPSNPVVTTVTFATTTVEITNITTQPATVFSIDSTGSIIQTAVRPTGDTLRTQFAVGFANHLNLASINSIGIATKAPIAGLALTVGDLSDAIGPIQPEGQQTELSANGANLSINFSTSTSYIHGERWATDSNSPNVFTNDAQIPASVFYTWRDGSGGFTVDFVPKTVLKPSVYDDGTGGASEPNGTVGALEFQNIMVFFAPVSDLATIQFGQVKYDSIIGAKNGRMSEFETAKLEGRIAPFNLSEVFAGFVTVRGDATDLSDPTQANFGHFQSIDRFYDDVTELGDGIIYNKDAIVTENSSVSSTTVELDRSNAGDVTVQLDGQSFTLADDGVDNVITLIPGTDTVPAVNYVYITRSGSKAVMNVSTTQPTVAGVGLFANVKKYVMQSAATTNTSGFLASHQTIDRFGGNDQSHIRHINTILRESAEWLSGVAQTVTVTTQGASKDDLFVSLTSGVVRQLHEHTWSSFSNGDDIYVANDQTTPYTIITNLDQVTTDTTGTTLEANNTFYHLTIWGAQDEDGTDRKVYVNKPLCSYSNSTDAITDGNNCAVRSFPTDFAGTGFLIANIIIQYTNASGGTLTIVQQAGADFEDLRQVGAGGGGTTITQTSFSDAVFSIFNSIDPTKLFNWDLSALTSGVTRTLTMADIDLDLGAIPYAVMSIAGSLLESDLNVNTPTDDYVLTASSTAAGGFAWAVAASGSGDVTAAASMTNQALIRGDGGVKGVEDSGWILDDVDALVAAGVLTMSTNKVQHGSGGYISFSNVGGSTGLIDLASDAVLNDSSGTEIFIDAAVTALQTGTAGYDAFDLNVTETAVGSGEKNLMNLKVGGTSQFKVSNSGVLTIGGMTATGNVDLNGATVKQHTYKTITWPGGSATTTTATTTIPLGTAFTAEAWNTAECYTTSGTASVAMSDGTNDMDSRLASTTVGRWTLATNNTFTVSEKRQLDVGALTASKISCTFDVTVNN